VQLFSERQRPLAVRVEDLDRCVNHGGVDSDTDRTRTRWGSRFASAIAGRWLVGDHRRRPSRVA
jgi:hypothetical protein